MDLAVAVGPPPPPPEGSRAPQQLRPRRGGAFSGQLAASGGAPAVARAAAVVAPRVDVRAALPDFEEWWAKEESQLRAKSSSSSSAFSGHYAVEPTFRVTEDELEEIRYSRGLPSWRLENREARLRPPRWLFVPERRDSPIQRLGTCRCRASEARPDFVRFCLRHLAGLRAEKGLVYATLGSGELYHDFEVVEGLRAAGCRIASVHAADAAYKSSIAEAGRNARSALQTLAAWLATDGVTFTAYDSIDALQAIEGSADVLMHSDAPSCPMPLVRRVLRPGGLYLSLAQGTGSPFEARRRPLEEAEELEEEDPERCLELLESVTWPAEVDGSVVR